MGLCFGRDLEARLRYYILPSKGDKSIISVSETGVLTSGAQTGSAAVHVVAQEKFGVNQTLVILVKVRL